MALQTSFSEPTIGQLTLMFRDRQINLQPGFQRQSVWTINDRRRLMQSVISGYPIPSIFLYKRHHNGRVIYDVIDGKQRLETVFMFTRLGRFKNEAFDTKLELGDGLQRYDWLDICKDFKDHRAAVSSYKIQAVEVTGDLAQIIDLFVRINSTGKRLTSGEKRHAKFYNSPFLKEAERLVGKFHKYLLQQRILSQAQIDRMKGTELFAELLMSIHSGGSINKKTSLDRAIGNDSVNGNTLHRLSREFVATVNLLKGMFPSLRETRFHNTVEFYTLFMLVWEMSHDGFVLHDRGRNRVALALLKKLSTGVDQLRDELRKGSAPKRTQPIYRDYLLTVQGDTDSSATRERRRGILKGLLGSLYERKDDKRTFSAEQRRIIWNSEEQHRCAKCRKSLAWDDFTIDHVIPWIKGGRTCLTQAQLLCRSCNSRKGAH